MGFSSGTDIAEAVIEAVRHHVADEATRRAIYKPIVDALEGCDWDTQDEVVGHDPAFDACLGPQYTPGVAGKSFCITGTLSEPREEVARLLLDQGATVTSNVTTKTTYLVVGDDPGAAKLEKAADLGIEQISDDELCDMMAQKPLVYPKLPTIQPTPGGETINDTITVTASRACPASLPVGTFVVVAPPSQSPIKVYGASDDLIEIEGAGLSEEISPSPEGSAYIRFTDGTQLKVEYADGIWRIEVVETGSAKVERLYGLPDDAPKSQQHGDKDAPGYSDVVIITGHTSYEGHGNEPLKPRITGPALAKAKMVVGLIEHTPGGSFFIGELEDEGYVGGYQRLTDEIARVVG